MTTETTKVTLRSFSDWEEWYGKLRSRCPDDLWPKIDPDQPGQRPRQLPVEPEYAQYHNNATTFADLTATERVHFENAFKQYQFRWQQYKEEQKVVKELKQYIRDTVAYSKQVTLIETMTISEWMEILYTSIRPTSEQMAQIATTKYRESLGFTTRNVTAWFDKWEEAMAVAQKYELFGTHKGMWIKDIYSIWRERFPFVAENLYTEYSAGSTPDLTYMEVSRLFRTKLDMEVELKRTAKPRASMRGSAFFTADSDEPTFMGEGVQETQQKAPKRKRGKTTTGSGPNKRKTKDTIYTSPCAACSNPKHTMQNCWTVTGAPEGRFVPERKRREVEERRMGDPEFDRLVQEVLRLKVDNSEDAD